MAPNQPLYPMHSSTSNQPVYPTHSGTSNQPVYPSQSSTIDPAQMCGDAKPNISSTAQWYTPVSYGYNESYITPYPSSTVESQPWAGYAPVPIPNMSYDPILHQQHHLQQTQQPQPQQLPLQDPTRPRSSPSTFGLPGETLTWVTTAGLGIQYPGITHLPSQSTPVSSAFPSGIYQNQVSPPVEGAYSNVSSPPEIRAPQPRRPLTSIAPNPNPAGIVGIKRRRDDKDQLDAPTISSKRRKRTSSLASANLNEENALLVQLREADEELPWKDIASRLNAQLGTSHEVATLQMRFGRLCNKHRVWEEKDIYALKGAVEEYEKQLEEFEKKKWLHIGKMMTDHGSSEYWPAKLAKKKWQELGTNAAFLPVTVTAVGMPSGLSQFSSPPQPKPRFTFMPPQ